MISATVDDSMNTNNAEDGMWATGNLSLEEETQHRRKMSGKDSRPIRVTTKGGDGGEEVNPKNQVLVYDMRK